MSNPYRSHLPLEILDYIVDLLHNEPETLQQCCLVSKSWVPRTRRHLFADVSFRSLVDLRAWKGAFPDPANSPAYHVHSLLVSYPHSITAKEGGWIRTFHNVVRLEVWSSLRCLGEPEHSLVPFHNFSPVLKSLRVVSSTIPYSQILNLVCSLPLLEDLCVIDHGWSNSDHDGTVSQPLTSSALTGTLKLSLTHGMEHVARRLLGLPNGLHFRKLLCTWDLEEHVRWITALVMGCSDTLECVNISYGMFKNPRSTSIDFSEAKKLKEVTFRLVIDRPHVTWVTMALQTITSEHRDFQRISIHTPYHSPSIVDPANLKWALGEPYHRQWMDLDRLLVQLWESRAVRPRIVYCAADEEQKRAMWECIENLLPAATERGITEMVDFVESHGFL